ncbi:Trm112 family protein [Paroceanicella profunda]|uniref:UPF0434 protein FDP22_05230 n=1 Tax=Paroceanicella profunda TaxID=2579971 RepID=A0A5B8FYJ0_9RHOB|nr:Trm112 family protein [Paroceanicella profunda]QDL91233.1 Trm112 family protein [Paroceanicella profunda]
MTDTPDTPEADAPRPPAFDRRMLEALVCPVTRGPLAWDAERQELVSKAAGYAFPVRQGIPIMLLDEARQLED